MTRQEMAITAIMSTVAGLLVYFGATKADFNFYYGAGLISAFLISYHLAARRAY